MQPGTSKLSMAILGQSPSAVKPSQLHGGVKRILEVRYALPYSDIRSLSESEKRRHAEEGEPLEFSHTLEDQISGQEDGGFLIAVLYEDATGVT